MDSRELLHQYSVGALPVESILAELYALDSRTESKNDIQESAKAKYVVRFIKRVQQHKSGMVSSRDLCLCVRDLAIIFGRIQLPEYVYAIVSQFTNAYGFNCEGTNTITCSINSPKWLVPSKYISDVYGLKINSDDLDSKSVGDKILSTHTVFNEYKNYEQKIAIHTAINLPAGQTLLVSQPTGGGKSLITQVLSAVNEGLTLVIVPTVALALDQFEAAKKNLIVKDGIFSFRGEQKQKEKNYIINEILEKRAHLVFSSPEAIIKNDALNAAISKCARENYLKNVVIDEAHIVPDWGIFFRPDFQIFSIVLKRWKAESLNTIRTFLLSATLSEDVVDTLFSLFRSPSGNARLRCDSLRKEPRFYFHFAKSKQEQDEKTIEAIERLPKPMVVYVLEPREATNLQKQLISRGYKNIPVFTGETKDADRDTVLKLWKTQEYDIVIATSAFGIGVDKSDVRTIIHACVPENLSRFYQEVGRAGRDHLPSLSVLLPYQSRNGEEGDIKRALGLVKGRVLRVETMISRWTGLMNHIISMDGDVAIFDTAATPDSRTYEETEFAGNLNMSWNVNLLLFLYRNGFIDLIDAVYQTSTNSYLITARLLKLEVLGDASRLEIELAEPRQNELDQQLQGYRVMRDLVQHPSAFCWGHAFKQLFPLAKELCSGCPADEHGKSSFDAVYKIRETPLLELKPQRPNKRLKRRLGSYQDLIITSEDNYDESVIQELANRAELCEIGAMVVPKQLAKRIAFNGLLLSYEEFYFSSKVVPYLFNKGIVCCFDRNQDTNYALMQSLEVLKALGYARILLCNELMYMPQTGKSVVDSLDANIIYYQQL